MRAVRLGPDGVTFHRDAPRPEPARGEVLVRVLQAGICETDLQLMRGYMGFSGVPGHEFVGVAQSGALAGRRVVADINCSCWTCPTCRGGLPTHCPHRSVLGILNHDGAFAEWIAVPERNLHPVPDAVPDRHAVFVEPVAAAFQILRQRLVERGQSVLILGDGRLGNLCAQVLTHHGCRVRVVGKHPRKLAVLAGLGIDTVLLDDVQPNRDSEVVVDCTGSGSGLETALRFVRPWGTVILKTTVAGQQTLSLAPVVIDEVRIVGSRCGPFPEAIAALERGQIQVEPLIAACYPLEQAVEALDFTASQPVLKVLLDVA